jgi:hypothetical protein
MKSFVFSIICLILSAGALLAQTGFSYQAVLRNEDGSLRTNESLTLEVELIQSDLAVYTESHSITTNDFGVFSIVVGEGAGEENYSPSIFLSSDSSSIPETHLRVSESGGDVLSETKILGVPVADVARVALSAKVGFPAGAVIPFAGKAEKIPDGWLLCDGSSYNTIEYADLYDAIGANWGTVHPDSFRVPDLRSVFLRGVNHGSADGFTDPDAGTRISRHAGGNIGNQVGSYQDDQFESHNHLNKTTFIVDGVGGRYSGGSWGAYSQNPAILNSGGNETRPQNAYVNYIIKY